MATNTTSSEDSILLNQIINQGVNIYGSREKIRATLIDYAKQYLNLGDADIRKTSYLAYLIDQLSILSANHLFYDATIYKEFFFTDAQMTESVHNLSKWIGYAIPKAVPATVDVMFTIPLSFSYDTIRFVLNPYFYVKSGDIPYIIKSNHLDSPNAAQTKFDQDYLKTYYKDNTDQQVQAVARGEIINNEVCNVRDSDGFYRPVYLNKKADKIYFMLPFVQKEILLKVTQVPNDLAINQFFSIPFTFNGQVCDLDVFVASPLNNQKLDITGSSLDGVLDAANFNPNENLKDSSGNICKWVKWKEADHGIYTMTPKSLEYSWTGGYNKGELHFGNGILGKQPPPGSIIVTRLHVTQGSRGNIIANTINGGDTIFTTVANNNQISIGYSVTNPNSAVNGADILTLPEIKHNAITNLAAKKRLVSEWDYDQVKTIVSEDVPLNDSYSILKRSDIKVNEIDVFTTLNYVTNQVNEIVPTRNAYITLTNPTWDDNGQFTLYRNYQVNYPLRKNPRAYLTMFNLTLDKKTEMAHYDYILQQVKGTTAQMYAKTQDNFFDMYVYMASNGCDFSIDTNKKAILGNIYPLNITFNVSHTPVATNETWENAVNDQKLTYNIIKNWRYPDQDSARFKTIADALFRITKFRCKMTTKWDKFNVYDDSVEYGYKEVVDKEDIGTTTGDEPAFKNKYRSFSWRLDNYADVPEGIQRFEFRVEAYCPNRDSEGNIYGIDGLPVYYNVNGTGRWDENKGDMPIQFKWVVINTYYCDVIVRRNLDNYMSSAITHTTEPNGDEIYKVHNVPVVLKDYYDNIIESDVNEVSGSNFELNVMQKLIKGFDLSDTRMMTDFVNIKMADTYGPMVNLRYNKPDYIVESRYRTPWRDEYDEIVKRAGDNNPEYYFTNDFEVGVHNGNDELDFTKEYYFNKTSTGIFYIINGPLNDEAHRNKALSEYFGHIALRIPTKNGSQVTYTWYVYEPDVGTYARVKDELDNEGYHKTIVWTGKEWKDVTEYQIPLQLKLKIEVDETKSSKSDSAIKEEIIDTLGQYFSNKMGIQKPLDRSEVIRVCRSIDGVVYAELLSPEVDIRFNYVMQDLTQKQLLDFTPSYIGFRGHDASENDYDRSTVDIQIIRK